MIASRVAVLLGLGLVIAGYARARNANGAQTPTFGMDANAYAKSLVPDSPSSLTSVGRESYSGSRRVRVNDGPVSRLPNQGGVAAPPPPPAPGASANPLTKYLQLAYVGAGRSGHVKKLLVRDVSPGATGGYLPAVPHRDPSAGAAAGVATGNPIAAGLAILGSWGSGTTIADQGWKTIDELNPYDRSQILPHVTWRSDRGPNQYGEFVEGYDDKKLPVYNARGGDPLVITIGAPPITAPQKTAVTSPLRP